MNSLLVLTLFLVFVLSSANQGGGGGGDHPPPGGPGGPHPPPKDIISSCKGSEPTSDGSFVEICVSLNKTDHVYRAEVHARPSKTLSPAYVDLHVSATGATLDSNGPPMNNCSLTAANSGIWYCYDTKNCSKPSTTGSSPSGRNGSGGKPPKMSQFHFNVTSPTTGWTMNAYLGTKTPSVTFDSTILSTASKKGSLKMVSVVE